MHFGGAMSHGPGSRLACRELIWHEMDVHKWVAQQKGKETSLWEGHIVKGSGKLENSLGEVFGPTMTDVCDDC